MTLDKVSHFVKLKPPVNVRYTSILCATQKNKTKLPATFITYIDSKTGPNLGDVKMWKMCAMVWMFVSLPKFICWKPNAQGAVISRWDF